MPADTVTPTDDKLLPDGFLQPEDDEQENDTGVQSVFSTLQGLRKEIGAGSTPLDLEVPGYNGLLLIRYKWIPYKEISQHSQQLKKIKDVTSQQLQACADSLAVAHQEFLIRVDDEIVPMSQTDIPITFADPRLAEGLGFSPVKTVRDGVKATFRNDYALIDQSNKVMEWLKDASLAVDADFLAS